MVEKLLKRQFVFLLCDAALVNLSLIVALLLRFDFHVPLNYLELFYSTFILITILNLVVFHLFGFYKKLWQYASIEELLSIIAAISLSTTAFYGLRFFNILYPRSIYGIYWALALIFIGGIRFLIRVRQILIRRRKIGICKNLLIVGAGEAGVLVAKEIENNQDRLMSTIVGFVDDDPAKKGQYIHNTPILGKREDIPELIKVKQVDEIIIAIPSASKRAVRDIVDICKELKVKLKILPGVFELINGKVSLKKLRDVEIQDLLKREPVDVNLMEIASYLQDKVVLVTGGGGSIGSELCRQILRYKPKELLILGHGENSIFQIYRELKRTMEIPLVPLIGSVQDEGRMEEIFALHKPEVVFHAAAHKHVALMEENPKEAIKNNVFGTRVVSDAASRYGVSHFVLVSTDKAVNPTSVMGATKRIAEMVMQTTARTSNTKFCAVRFGNVLGSRGSVVPIFREQIAAGGPVTVTHPDMVRYFMTIPEAVQLIIQAGAMGQEGEIFILDMGEPVKITDLAEDLIRLSGYEPGKDIEIKFTGMYPGEKLREEILTELEGVSSTKHQKIFITDANSADEFKKEILSLKKLLHVDDGRIDIISLMFETDWHSTPMTLQKHKHTI